MNCVANIYKKNSSSSSTTLYLSASYIFLCHFFCCCFVFCHQTHHKYLDCASKRISIVRCKMMKWSGIQLRWLHKSINNCEINQLSEFHSFFSIANENVLTHLIFRLSFDEMWWVFCRRCTEQHSTIFYGLYASVYAFKIKIKPR